MALCDVSVCGAVWHLDDDRLHTHISSSTRSRSPSSPHLLVASAVCAAVTPSSSDETIYREQTSKRLDAGKRKMETFQT